MIRSTTATQARLKLASVLVFLAVVAGVVASGTTAVSAALTGSVGPPAVTTPIAMRSLEAQPSVRLAAVGDVGTGSAEEWKVASQVASVAGSDPFDALILLGDNVYPDGNAERLEATVFEPFAPVLEAGTDLLAVLGNHDEGYAAEQVQALGMHGRWYSTQIDSVLFIGLDSTDTDNPEQSAWLERTLGEATADWIIVGLHHPPFSAGTHGSDEDARDVFVPVFERYGVDVVLAGHDHDYQRSVPIGGVTYVVSGAGAKVRDTGTADFTVTSAAVLHFVEIAVWDDRLEMTAIGLNGSFDHSVVRADAINENSAADFPIPGGLFFDDDTSMGARLAAVGAALWIIVMVAAWVAPRVAAMRAERVLVVSSTASMLSIITGIGMVAVGLAV